MDTWQVTQGKGATWRVTVCDGDGLPVTTFTGAEALAGSVRPGRSTAPVATLAPTWVDPSQATIDVPIPAQATATLAAGTYLVQVALADNSADLFEGQLEVGYGPGTEALPPVYCTFDDLLDYASWIEKLRTDRDLTGFARQRGRARSWLDDILVALWKPTSMAPQVGQPGYGAWSMGLSYAQDPGPSRWLRDQLAADSLIVRDQTIEIVAKRAIYLIGMPQVAKLDQPEQRMARDYGHEAEQLVRMYRAEIDLPDSNGVRDGYAEIVIHGGSTSLR